MTSKKEVTTEISRLIINATDSKGNNIPIIGSAMAWSYSKSEYDQDKVIDAFRINNLDTKHIEKGAERIEAVKRALNKAKSGGLLREVEEYRYQITEESKVELANASRLEYSLKEIIVYDEETERFIFEDETGHQHEDRERSDELMKRVKHFEMVFANRDITRYTKTLFKNKGIVSLKSSGGLYFVPAKFNSLVNDVRNMFGMIDPGGMFMLIEIPDTANAKQSVGVSAVDMFKEKVKTLKDTLDAHKADREKRKADGTMKKGKHEGTVTNKKAKTQLDEIAALAGDIEILSECLGFDLVDAKEAVGEYKKELLSELGVSTEEEFQAKNTKKPKTEKVEAKPEEPAKKEDEDLELGEVKEEEFLSPKSGQGELLFN